MPNLYSNFSYISEQAKEHPEIYVPGCDPDGTWSAFQYWAGGQEWWCVTAEGEYVNGTLHYADAPDPQFCDQYRTTTSTSTTPNPGKRVKGKKKGF